LNTRVGVDIESARLVLSAILRRAAPAIISRVADEAATAAGRPDVREAYVALMEACAPDALDAVGSNDRERARLLSSLATTDAAGAPPVPPLARAGLLEIGLRLAYDIVAREAAAHPDGGLIESEFIVLAHQMRDALAALAGRGEDATS
jgi:hypothetical protein